MKRTLSIITIALTALLLLLASCNSDASAGLFRQLADSKEPVGIRYKQILGRNVAEGTLYFLTDDGIYSKKNDAGAVLVKENEKNKPILSAYLDSTDDVFYSINTSDGLKIYKVNAGAAKDDLMHPIGAKIDVDQQLRKLLPNGYLVAQGTSDGKRGFSVFEWNFTTDDSVVSEAEFLDLDGWSLYDVLLPPATSQTSTNFIISFVSDSGDYKHFYNAKANVINLNTALASFTESGGKLYLLGTDGRFYKSDTPANNEMIPTLQADTKKPYQNGAFLYPVIGLASTHFITKSNAANEAFTVITGDKAVSVKDGYAKHMNNVNIVSALEIYPDDAGKAKLLIATHENGMFGLEIPFATANSNSNTGSSTAAEEYKVN
ncbi:MAG: hypothetical protein WC233_05755 [Sphaerochaeta sp.]